MRSERVQACKSRRAHHEKQYEANPQQPFLRLRTRHNAPLRAEQPDPIREVPRGRDQSHYVEQEEQRMHNLTLHFAERRHRMFMQINPGKPHRPGMPNDVGESNAAGRISFAIILILILRLQ